MWQKFQDTAVISNNIHIFAKWKRSKKARFIEETNTRKAMHITYGTNNEFGFDYLRDNMVTYKENRVQRGFNYAIVDEVDSILIDEARTPLIISGKGEDSSKLYEMADTFVAGLRKQVFAKTDEKEVQDDYDCDYFVDEKSRTVSLTASGIAKAEKYFGVENLADPENATLSHHINQAVKPLFLMWPEPHWRHSSTDIEFSRGISADPLISGCLPS